MDKKYSIEQLGWCKAENGEYIYCAGDMIISKEGKSQNDANLPITQKFHLEIDNDLYQSVMEKRMLLSMVNVAADTLHWILIVYMRMQTM